MCGSVDQVSPPHVYTKCYLQVDVAVWSCEESEHTDVILGVRYIHVLKTHLKHPPSLVATKFQPHFIIWYYTFVPGNLM